MFKFGALILGTFMLIGGNAVLAGGPNDGKEEICYRDSASESYGDTGTNSATMENMKIEYTTRTLDTHTLALRFPCFDYSPAIGSCAAIAGGNLIGFYDRYDENLIPNHSSGSVFGNTYLYNIEDTEVHAVIRELYDYMGTSTSGTTEKQFKDGITDFCNDKGHSVTFSSCMQGGSFSFSTAKTYLDRNQPIVLFLNSYNVANMVERENYDAFSYYVSEVPHIMIGFGYKTYVYDGTRTYNYLSVASGITGHTSGLYNIDYKTKINNALAVNIT